MTDLYFICGIHGVGKTSVCTEVTKKVPCHHWTASRILKEAGFLSEGPRTWLEGAEYYTNQMVLADIIDEKRGRLTDGNPILLDGHCVLKTGKDFFELPDAVLKKIRPKELIFITASPERIKERLREKGDRMGLNEIKSFQNKEAFLANHLASCLGIPVRSVSADKPIEAVADEIMTIIFPK